jgi:hypothetical protein
MTYFDHAAADIERFGNFDQQHKITTV